MSITDTISKNNICVFTKVKSRQISKKDEQLKSTKNNVALFSRLFIACQSREENLKQFFARKNRGFPPTLSEKRELCPAKVKSGVINCVLKTGHARSSETSCIDVKIFDGPALVNMLPPTNCKTFLDYTNNVFLPNVETHSKT